MKRVTSTQQITYIFTDLIRQEEIEVDLVPHVHYKVGQPVNLRLIGDNNNIFYYIKALEVQVISSQIIIHIKVMPL